MQRASSPICCGCCGGAVASIPAAAVPVGVDEGGGDGCVDGSCCSSC